MQSAQQAREARRKRILDRGSDRLAFITGELKHSPKTDLSASSPGSSTREGLPEDKFENALSVSKSLAKKSDKGLLHPQPLLGETVAEDVQQQDSSQYQRVVQENVVGDVQQQPTSIASPANSGHPPDLQYLKTEGSVSQPLSQGNASEDVQQQSTSSTSSSNPGHLADLPCLKSEGSVRQHSQVLLVRSFVTGIDVSESLRAPLALFIGVLVVCQTLLTCCGHQWGTVLSSWLPRWPVILVLLTDVTAVLGTCLLKSIPKQQDNSHVTDDEFDSFSKVLDLVGKFGELLDIGVLCRRIVAALSVDCSIYAVTVVCGLCLGQYWYPCCQMPSSSC